MNNVIYLRLEERVSLDRDQLEVLLNQLGPVGADQLVSHAMEELAVLLARVEKHHNKGRLDDVREGVKGLIAIAQQIGMTSLARVGRDVLVLIQSQDSAAYCATFDRLVRLGEGSLVAVWDMQDMSV